MGIADITFLSQEDVLAAGGLDMSLAVPTMEEVFRLHYKQDYVLPRKSVLRWGDHASEAVKGRINALPGSIGGDIQAVGIKWLGSSPQNPGRYNIPDANGVIILNDPETLAPMAIMDANVISAARTGANTAVAAKYLAKKDSAIVGLIGAGVQNRTQLLALHYVFPHLSEIRIYDINAERAEIFAQEMSAKIRKPVTVANSAAEAVSGADIYVTATVATQPIIKAEWLVPGVFYSHVGNHECEFEAIQKLDKIVVDSWEGVKHRQVGSLAIMYQAGLLTDAAIYAELGKIVSGDIPGRENDNEIIYLNTVGMGIEDVALAYKVLQRAREMKLGQPLRLWQEPFAV